MIIKSGTVNLTSQTFYLGMPDKRKEWIQEDKRETAQSSTEGKYFKRKGGRL